ncbi:MAG: ParB/RepB/Spo0J family partition protein [Alphaproteobacteria bacterium]
MNNEFDYIPISQVRVDSRKRSPKGLDRLMPSISEIGLLNPITVTAIEFEQEGSLRRFYRLAAGLSRLEACKLLGWEYIPAFIRKFDNVDLEIAEIDENLVRSELTVLERGEQYLRRKELYETKHPETKHGANLKSVENQEASESRAARTSSFVEDTAKKTGAAPRTVTEDVQIAAKLDPWVKKMIRNTDLADHKKELVRLARIGEAETQTRVAEIVVRGEASSVAHALNLVTGKSATRKRRVRTVTVPLHAEKAASILAGKFAGAHLDALIYCLQRERDQARGRSDAPAPEPTARVVQFGQRQPQQSA